MAKIKWLIIPIMDKAVEAVSADNDGGEGKALDGKALFDAALPELNKVDKEIESADIPQRHNKSGWTRLMWLCSRRRAAMPGAKKASQAATDRELLKKRKRQEA